MKISAENTIAVVIDYQEKLVPAMSEQEALVKKSKILLGGLKALGIPMIVTTQYAKGLGNTIEAVTSELAEAPVIDKNTFSVMDNEEVRQAIPKNTENIIVCGMEAHICVLQSIIDFQAAGYQTIMVADCISSRSQEDKAYSLIRGEKEGTIITTAEAILYELLGGSKHPAFKTISSLVK